MFIYVIWYITYVMMMIPTAMLMKKGGLCCVVESSGVAYDVRRFTLVTLPAGLMSCSSNVDTDASHTTTVLGILLVKFYTVFIIHKYLRSQWVL